MRKFLISAVIVGLVGSASLAMAQDQDHHPGPGGGEPHAGAPGGAPHPAPHATPGPATRGGPAMTGHRDVPAGQRPVAAPNAMRGNPAPGNAMRGNPGPANAMRGNPGPANAMRGNAAPRPNSNNAMRGNTGPRRDFSSARDFHQNFSATRRFHAPAYRQPPGYYSRRWTWGQTLPAAFWARNYWLTDFGAYDLPPPPFGAVWVRVGSDALLIDQNSGQIIEVEYGVFY